MSQVNHLSQIVSEDVNGFVKLGTSGKLSQAPS